MATASEQHGSERLTCLLQGTLRAKLDSGDAHQVCCPHNCPGTALPALAAQQLLSPGEFSRFQSLLAQQFVDVCPDLKWYAKWTHQTPVHGGLARPLPCCQLCVSCTPLPTAKKSYKKLLPALNTLGLPRWPHIMTYAEYGIFKS